MTDTTGSQTLAQRFEAHRAHLRGMAYRMLGSTDEAEDAVQEAWLRLSRAEAGGVDNLGGWLTTVVARVCLDALRARKARREDALSGDAHEADASRPAEAQPDSQLGLADSVGLALLVVLETLAPAERIAFVLHDLFDLPFDEIAAIVERTPEATRQLASRARRRVQGVPPSADPDRTRQRQVVQAFLAASRSGDFDALLATLDPDAVLRVDRVALDAAAQAGPGAPRLAPEVRGARAVAESFHGRARGARPALIDGRPGAAWAPGGTPRALFVFALARGADGHSEERIAAIEIVADPARVGAMHVELQEAEA